MKMLIKVGDNYGLCNRLFPFANLIAASLEYGFRIRHAAFFEYADFFEGTAGQAVPEFPTPEFVAYRSAHLFQFRCRVLRKLRLESAFLLGKDDMMDFCDPRTRDALRGHSIQLVGLYFLESQAFPKHAASVRHYFRPVQPLQTVVDRTLEASRREGKFVIGVHVRHGDYETFANGMLYYSWAEYAELMKHVAELFADKPVTFLICSNVAIPKSAFDGFSYTIAPGHPAIDLYCLAACDAIIGPPSTFTEWASFYGEVPRYQHRKKDYLRRGVSWPGVRAEDFKVHDNGFGRCALDHFVPLRK